jgi:hypothetical protein
MKIVVRQLLHIQDIVRVVKPSSSVSDIKWLTNNRIAYVEYGTSARVIEADVLTGQMATILWSRRKLMLGAWNPSARLLAYSYAVGWKWRGRASVKMNDAYSTMHYIEPRWARQTVTHIAVMKLGKSIGAPARSVPLKMSEFLIPPELVWKAGQLLAVVQSMVTFRSRIFDVVTGARVHSGLPLFNIEAMAISQSGRIAVVSTRIWRNRRKPMAGWNGTKRVYVLDHANGVREISAVSRRDYLIAITGLKWVGKNKLLIQMMGSRGLGGPDRWWLEEVNWRTDRVLTTFRWRRGDLGGIGIPCSFDEGGNVGVCVAQTMDVPPELVRIVPARHSMVPIAPMSPNEQRLNLKFQPIKIENRFHDVSTGFLVLPANAKTQPVPLAVMAYGFTEAYSKDAQWISSYPVARMVQSGIAVCMVTWAHIRGFKSNRLTGELRAMEGDVSTLESVPREVRRRGVSISRAMVMGWSFGGLFAAHVIETDPEYVAAQVGDPADWTIAGYALGNEHWRNVSQWGLGGPPIDGNIKNYVAMDPVGSGMRPKGPILLEFVSQNPAVGQLFEEWRAVGANVEAFVYRHSVHWLNVPAEARVSRLRNLYWAKLNLLGPKAVTAQQLHSVGLEMPKSGWWMH